MIDRAKAKLREACQFYCKWYDTGEFQMSPDAVAYELVSWCREALLELNDLEDHKLKSADHDPLGSCERYDEAEE